MGIPKPTHLAPFLSSSYFIFFSSFFIAVYYGNMKVAILLGLLLSAVVVKAHVWTRCLDGNNDCPDVWDYARKNLLWEWQKKKDDIRNMEKLGPNDQYRKLFAGELRQWKATLAQLEERIRIDKPEGWEKINGPMAAMEKRRAAFNRRMAAMEKRRAAFNRQMAAFNRQMAAMDK